MKSLYYEGQSLRPVGRVLWEVEKKAERMGIAEARANLWNDCINRAKVALAKGEERRHAVHGADELKAYQKWVRDTFIDSIGGLPSFDTPLNAKVVGTHDMGNYILENIIYESRPHTYVTANLYRPAHLDHKAPGVFVPLGHTDLGKGFDEYQRVAQMLVYAGFVVLLMDPIGEGERFEHYEKDIEQQPIQGCSGEHDLLDWKCKATGESLVRYFIHDGMRGIEYLKSRSEVDADKVAVTGHSGGGTQTSVLMTAAAHMLCAAAPCSYTTDKIHMYEYGKDPDTEMIWPGVVAEGIDYADIMAGMAPKPVMILCNRYDFFPWEGTDHTYEEITDLWKRGGAKEENMPQLTRVTTGHAYALGLAEAVTHFFAKHMMGHDVDLTGFEYKPNGADILNCTKSGQIVKEFADLITTQDLLDVREAKLKEARLSLPYEERLVKAKEWLKASVEYARVPAEPHVRCDDEGIMAHYVFRALEWRPQEGYFNHGILLRDMRHGDGPLPTVIALWENGTRAIELHSHWIHKQCAMGRQVLIVEVAGVGNAEPNPISNSNLYIGWCTFYNIESYLMDMGDSLAALRTYQLIQALRVLPDLPLDNPTEQMFYGEGEYARYAKVASLLTGVPVIDNSEYQNYGEIVVEKYPDQTHTMDWNWPGILQVTDMEEIDDYLQNEKLLLHE